MPHDDRPEPLPTRPKRWRGAVLATALSALAAPGLAADPQVISSWGISPFGNLKYPQDFKHLDYVNPDAPKGGEISEWAFGGFDSMNPYIQKGRAAALSSIFYESLLTGVADEHDAEYCLICKTLEYPEDRSWVIFNLRHGVKFSDGTPLTAEDVAFSFNLLATKGLPSLRFLLERQVAKVEVLGPYRIKFTFKPGYPTRDLPATVGGLPIFSKADYEKNHREFSDSTLKPFVGSGPYVLGRIDVGQTIVYKRNPDYWGRNLPINVGRNNFDRIRFEYYADYNSAFEGFKAANYTFRIEASSVKWATGYDFPGMQKHWVKKAELPDGSLTSGQSFIFNLARPQFQDIRVREAIGLMFNFQWTNAKLFYGLYRRIESFWQNSDLAASGKPSAAELKLLKPLAQELPPGVLTEDAVMAPVSGARQLDRRNLRKASALLDAAGWKVGADGKRRNAKGQLLKVTFLNDSKTFDRIINPFVENLKALGVDASLEDVDNAQQRDRERQRDFDIITAQFPMSFTPGAGLQQYFGSGTADTSIFNKMGLKNKAVDALIEDVMSAKTEGDLKTSVHALDRVLRALHFWMPEWYQPNHLVAYYAMYGHPKVLPPYSLGELDFWWYDAKKAAALKAAGALR
jgi:microcin C transport system substrate-binding protein